jgi:hypothetical protein
MDIGGAGHSSDATAIWIAQFVGREIRLLDYIEGVGQPLAYYAGNTIGRAMLRMRSATWPSVMKSRQRNLRASGDHPRREVAAIGRRDTEKPRPLRDQPGQVEDHCASVGSWSSRAQRLQFRRITRQSQRQLDDNETPSQPWSADRG